MALEKLPSILGAAGACEARPVACSGSESPFHQAIPSSSSVVIGGPGMIFPSQRDHVYYTHCGRSNKRMLGTRAFNDFVDRRRIIAKLASAVQRLQLIAPVDWLKRIDAWRRHQPQTFRRVARRSGSLLAKRLMLPRRGRSRRKLPPDLSQSTLFERFHLPLQGRINCIPKVPLSKLGESMRGSHPRPKITMGK